MDILGRVQQADTGAQAGECFPNFPYLFPVTVEMNAHISYGNKINSSPAPTAFYIVKA